MRRCGSHGMPQELQGETLKHLPENMRKAYELCHILRKEYRR